MQIKEPSKMLSKMIVLFLFMNIVASKSQVIDFKYNGFLTAKANMSLDVLAQITPNGVLRLTNTSKIETGHAFYSLPIPFRDSSSGIAISFSTTFVIAIVPELVNFNGHGMTFVISPSKDLAACSTASEYIGLFNLSSNGNLTNHIVAIEFDTVKSPEFKDIDGNHVGIDVNSLTSVESMPAAYFTNENGGFKNLTLGSGTPIQVWVEYSGLEKKINVMLSPINEAKRTKPNLPLLSLTKDLSPIIKDSMYVGFSSATGSIVASSHYLLGWSFKMNGPAQVAVKRVSHKSKQGMREFIAEIVSLGRLRHRNLVQLLGYCRRKRELLLVYDFMLNGSLDKFLFDEPAKILNWHQRFQIIKGVASGLLYLHEGWEQVVLHRDIKASNVLLDGEFNGRLGDIGLARLYDHGTNPHTTHVVGTLGYIAPEMTRTGKATTSTDVFAFGAFMLEVTCGKRPIGPRGLPAEEIILVDWVLHCWRRGEILEARDVRLGNEYVKEEMELVLKLGLLCSHPMAAGRPSMRQVTQFLDGDCPTPELSLSGWSATIVSAMVEDEMSREMESLYPSTTVMERSVFECLSSCAESLLSGGR